MRWKLYVPRSVDLAFTHAYTCEWSTIEMCWTALSEQYARVYFTPAQAHTLCMHIKMRTRFDGAIDRLIGRAIAHTHTHPFTQLYSRAHKPTPRARLAWDSASTARRRRCAGHWLRCWFTRPTPMVPPRLTRKMYNFSRSITHTEIQPSCTHGAAVHVYTQPLILVYCARTIVCVRMYMCVRLCVCVCVCIL